MSRGVVKGSTPDITPAQIVAIVQAVIGLLIAFGVDLSKQQQAAVLQLSTALLVVLPLVDAWIRHSRNMTRVRKVAPMTVEPDAAKLRELVHGAIIELLPPELQPESSGMQPRTTNLNK